MGNVNKCTEEECRRVDRLLQMIAAYDKLLVDICNEYMEINTDGSFKSDDGLSKRANSLLGMP